MILVILGSIFVWAVIGSAICAYLDSKYYKGALLAWATECPLKPGAFWVSIIWPVILYSAIKDIWRHGGVD